MPNGPLKKRLPKSCMLLIKNIQKVRNILRINIFKWVTFVPINERNKIKNRLSYKTIADLYIFNLISAYFVWIQHMQFFLYSKPVSSSP